MANLSKQKDLSKSELGEVLDNYSTLIKLQNNEENYLDVSLNKSCVAGKVKLSKVTTNEMRFYDGKTVSRKGVFYEFKMGRFGIMEWVIIRKIEIINL